MERWGERMEEVYGTRMYLMYSDFFLKKKVAKKKRSKNGLLRQHGCLFTSLLRAS